MTVRLVLLLTAAAVAGHGEKYTFSAGQSAEMTAEIEMSSPGSDWAQTGREAAVATVMLDGRHEQHVVLFAGARPHTYRVFLGNVLPGDHEITIERNVRHSARGSQLKVQRVSFQPFTPGDPYHQALAHAPILFARTNTLGKFSDVPLIMYVERVEGFLRYTVVFSNEDGGTSTRALMARWGRTTDIEYVYRVSPETGQAFIQTRGHKEVRFSGHKAGSHPLLIPVTDNNMVAGEGSSALRFQLAPALVELKDGPREQVMDAHPVLWEVMAKELAREDKFRPFGVAAGEKISDPRNYVYLEYLADNVNAALSVTVRLKSDRVARNSSLGRLDYAVERSGWVRTAVELPPGTPADALWEISFDCLVAMPKERAEPFAHSGSCRIERIGRMFQLDENYRPGPNLWKAPGEATLRTGESAVFLGW